MAKKQTQSRASTARERHEGGYDEEMIRDFLRQLRVEVESSLYEAEAGERRIAAGGEAPMPESELNPAMMEELRLVSGRRGNRVLLPVLDLDTTDATREEVLEASAICNMALLHERKEQMEHLKALEELFDEAILAARVECGRLPNGAMQFPRREVSARNLIDGVRSGKLTDDDE